MSIRRIERAPLRNTFGIDARIELLIETDDAEELPDLFARGLAGASSQDPELLVLGSGSNLLIVEGPKIALHLDSQRIEALDAEAGIVRAEAGVEWHRFVLWTLEHGFAGLENLALIPGSVGASPVTMIGDLPGRDRRMDEKKASARRPSSPIPITAAATIIAGSC